MIWVLTYTELLGNWLQVLILNVLYLKGKPPGDAMLTNVLVVFLFLSILTRKPPVIDITV